MTTIYALTLAQATANLRTDLNDPAGASQRWQDTDLQRGLDRAVERITAVEPDLETIELATVKGVLIYPKPTGALWIDRIEYPSGQWPPSYPAFSEYRSPRVLDPTGVLTGNTIAGGGLSLGNYTWNFTYTTPGGGETLGGSIVVGSATAGQAASFSSVPTGGPGVTGRNIYRTVVNLTQLKLVGSIPDNTTTTFLDTKTDGQLGVNIPTVNTTAGIDVFALQIPPEQAPSDTTSTSILVSYALKHELDTNGTTIPERHWDTLYLGARVAAIDIYLANISDNFVYADGQLRDRVDDTKSVDAWRSLRDLLEASFVQRLKLIRDEQIQSSRFSPAWGDKPLRWERV